MWFTWARPAAPKPDRLPSCCLGGTCPSDLPQSCPGGPCLATPLHQMQFSMESLWGLVGLLNGPAHAYEEGQALSSPRRAAAWASPSPPPADLSGLLCCPCQLLHSGY